MNITELQERLTKKETAIQKAIDRLNYYQMKVLDNVPKYSWSNEPIMEQWADDICSKQNEVKELKAQAETLRQKIESEKEKAASRNVAAITEFLNQWEIRVKKHYQELMERYYKESSDVYKLYEQMQSIPWDQRNGHPAQEEYLNARKTLDNRLVYGSYAPIRSYICGRRFEDAFAVAVKEIAREKVAKYDFIIQRTNAIVGKITDARGLSVGSTGELNGLIIGDKSRATVTTIGAGGYNIQCFHFRTLIHEVK